MTTSTTSRDGSRLGGLAKTSLREQALAALRTAITCRSAPGTHLVETEFSSTLGISRGTLREAMRQLQQEGLVEAGDRGRLSVRTLSVGEIEEMFLVRAALEGLAASLLAASPDREAQVPTLQRALDDLAAATGSVNEMVEIDLEFHRTMCALTGNSTLVHAWESVLGSIRTSIMFAGPDSAITNMSVRRHQTSWTPSPAGTPGWPARWSSAICRRPWPPDPGVAAETGRRVGLTGPAVGSTLRLTAGVNRASLMFF
ncbi:MAG: GntR family transcriptional regulator [Nakamurella multipartita]